MQLHVVLAIDRAGIVGDDGPTHHGVFDVGFLRQVPGMRILAPVSLAEQQDMLRWAVEECTGPVAIRYPRGTEGSYTCSDWHGPDHAQTVCHRHGKDVTFLTYGTMLDSVMQAAEQLGEMDIEATVLRLLTISDISAADILQNISEKHCVIVVEEVCNGSGIREDVAYKIVQQLPDCRVEGIDLGRDFVPHGSQKELYKHCGVDPESIVAFTKEVLSR